MKVALIVLNYNQKELLEMYLGSVVRAAKESRHEARVFVLDNRSIDGSVKFVKEHFKNDVSVVVAEENKVLCSYNPLVETLNDDVIILLNNDLKVDEGFVDPLVERFSDKNVFFVAPKIMDITGARVTGGKMDFHFKYGIFKNRLKGESENDFSFFVGSSAAYSREKFLALGGYDPMYLPGTGEDQDLCYRAWQRGWRGVREERSVVYHHDSYSFDRDYGKPRRQTISCRNAYLVVWKNVRDKWMFAQSIFFYLVFFVFNALRLRFDLVKGAIAALYYIPETIQKRRAESGFIKLRDSEIKQIIQEV